MINISFDSIAEKISGLVLPQFDLIVGIGRGGIVPAALLAYKLEAELNTIYLRYRDDENEPCCEEPAVVGEINIPESVKSVLLVDDVAVSGKTINTAKKMLEGKGCIVKTFVLKGAADYVVFSELNDCVNWPWKRVMQGERIGQ